VLPDVLVTARAAAARHDWPAAAELLEAARLDDPEADAQRLDLLATVLWWLGRLEESIEAGEEAYRLHEESGDVRAAGYAAVWLYERNCQHARPSIGSAWLQRARRALDGDDECVEFGSLILREAELGHGGGRPARRRPG
jgi:hypothetical protein